jgi:Zn finger protein HypA/HybF involved in hydrogenase expression
MHDIHVANKVYNLVMENAKNNGLEVVKKIEIDLGSIIEHGADITAENLDFNLKMLGETTFDKNIEIKINRVDGNDWKLVSISG